MARSSLGPGLDGILVVAKPAGPTSHDVVALVRRLAATQARRSRRDARSVRDGRAAGLPRPRDADRRVPPRRPQGVPRDRLLRGVVDDRRPRGRADARPTARRRRARRSRRRSPAFTGTILAAAARLQRDQGRWSARLRDGAGRRDRRAREPRRSRSTRSTSSTWDGTDPERPIAVLDVACSAGHVRPGARARPRRGRRAAPPTSARSTRTAIGPVHARRTPSPLDDDPGGGRRRTRRASLPLLRPLDTGLEAFPAVALTPTRSRPSRVASSCARPPACPIGGRRATGCVDADGARCVAHRRRRPGGRARARQGLRGAAGPPDRAVA